MEWVNLMASHTSEWHLMGAMSFNGIYKGQRRRNGKVHFSGGLFDVKHMGIGLNWVP